jgi:hypothetical protein
MPPEGILYFAKECVDECLHHGVLATEFYSDPAFIRERMMPPLAGAALRYLFLWPELPRRPRSALRATSKPSSGGRSEFPRGLVESAPGWPREFDARSCGSKTW